MTTKLTRFDAADYLRGEEDIANDLAEIAENGDPELLASALGDVARSRNMSQLAHDTGLSRVGLNKALSAGGNPSFTTISKVAKALGFRIVFEPVRPAHAAKRKMTAGQAAAGSRRRRGRPLSHFRAGRSAQCRHAIAAANEAAISSG